MKSNFHLLQYLILMTLSGVANRDMKLKKQYNYCLMMNRIYNFKLILTIEIKKENTERHKIAKEWVESKSMIR